MKHVVITLTVDQFSMLHAIGLDISEVPFRHMANGDIETVYHVTNTEVAYVYITPDGETTRNRVEGDGWVRETFEVNGPDPADAYWVTESGERSEYNDD